MQKEDPFLEQIQEDLRDLSLETGSVEQREIEQSIFERFEEPEEDELIEFLKKRPNAPDEDAFVGYATQKLQRSLEKKSHTIKDDAILSAIARKLDVLRTDAIPIQSESRFTEVQGPSRPRDPPKINFIFSDRDKHRLDCFLDSKTKKYEIEASFGTIHNGFWPGFRSFPAFHALKVVLDERASKSSVNKTSSIEIVNIMKNVPSRQIIRLPSGSVFWQKKIRRNPNTGQLAMIENSHLGVRVYKSSEIFVPFTQVEQEMKKAGITEFIPTMTRIKRRTSYLEFEERSPMRGLRFDLTIVEETKFPSKKSFIKGEVEIERVNDYATTEGMIEAIKNVLIWSQRAPNFDYVIGLPERKFAVRLHNNLFWYDQRFKTNPNPFLLISYYWNKPRNIKVRDLLNPSMNWSLTVKLNGVRKFLLVDKYATYLFGPPFDVIRIGSGTEKFNGTLIDGEFMRKEGKNEIHCFDVLFVNGQDVRSSYFEERQKFLRDVVSHLKTLKDLDTQIHIKKFYSKGSLYERIEKALASSYELPVEDQDGLIFQPHNWYYNRNTLKWKPEDQLTIDFEVVPDLEDRSKVRLLVGCKKNQRPFTGSNIYPLDSPAVTLSQTEIDGEPVLGRIVEFKWDGGVFTPIRIRDDRDCPNNLKTATDVWNDIMNPISEDTIYGDTLQVARKFFNNIKLNMLTSNFSRDDTIVDIGSGRGGDLSKWRRIGLNTVYAVDPNEQNLKELETRLGSMGRMNTNVRIVNMGAEQTEGLQTILRKDKSRLDGIVAFFSLTFFTQTPDMYKSLIKTIDLLPVGGKFIGMVMDGEKTRELLEKAKTEDLDKLTEEYKTALSKAKTKKQKAKIKTKYENKKRESAVYITRAYSITQLSQFTHKPTGNKILIDIHEEKSMVKDQEEWLFYFEPFKNSLESLGFTHQEKPYREGNYGSNFIDGGPTFDILPESSQTFCSLFRVFVFTKHSTFKKFKTVVPKIRSSSRLPNPYSDELYIIGVPSTPSSLFYSSMWSFDRTFRKKKDPEGEIADLRKELSEKLTLEEFRNLSTGEKVTEKNLNEVFEHYKRHLEDPTKYLSKERFLNLIETALGIKIYILRGTLSKGWITSVNVVPSCSSLGNSRGILLYTIDDITFYPIKRKQTFLFSHVDPLIQKISREACHETFT